MVSTPQTLMPRTRQLHLVHGQSAPGRQPAALAREHACLAIVPLLALAERRITDAELDRLDASIAALPERPDRRQRLQFGLQFWALVAAASRNPWLEQQVRTSGGEPYIDLPCASYRGLARALRHRNGTVDYWLSALEPSFEATEARLAAAGLRD